MSYLKRPELKITLTFLIISVTWIILSDHFFYVLEQAHDELNETAIQTIKGSFYVVAVSLLMYYMVKKAQQQLLTSQHELQELFDNTPNPMFVLDAGSETICRVNAAALEQFGYSKEQLSTMPFSQLRTTGGFASTELSVFQFTRKSGEVITCQETRRFIQHRNRASVLVSITDITAIEKIKNDLYESERQLQQVLSSITDGLFILDKNLNITKANDVFCKLADICEKQIKNKNLLEVLPGLKRDNIYNNLKEAIANHSPLHFDTRYAKSACWFRVSAYPFDGGLSVFFRDITREKDNEIDRYKNQQNLLALINNTSDLIWSIDSNYCYFTYNEPYENWYRTVFNDEIWTGKKALNDKQGQQHVQRWKYLYERALKGEKFSLDMDFTVNNTHYFTTVSFNPIYNSEHKVIGVGCFLQNITDRKLYEQQIEQTNKKLKEITFITSFACRLPIY